MTQIYDLESAGYTQPIISFVMGYDCEHYHLWRETRFTCTWL